MNSKSICFVNSNRPWGGGEKWSHDHALLLRDRDYRVSAVTNQTSELGDRLARRGIPLLRLPLGNLSFLNPLHLSRLRRFFQEQAVDTVLLALPADLKAGGLAARLAGVPQIIFRRGLARPTRDTYFNRLLYGEVITKLLCNSVQTRDMVLAANPDIVPASRIFIVPNGFDVTAYDALPAEPLVQRRPGEVLIGTAGRLTEQKGQKFLLEAAALLKKRGLRFRVLVAGTGELEDPLKTLARRLELDGVVEFLGFVADMKRFYASLDIFALPSLWEGFGYALVEAMALEKPVAAFASSSTPEVVQHEVTGLLTPTADATALAWALDRLAREPELRARFGKAGRHRVLEHYDTPKTLAALEQVLAADTD